MKMIFIQEYPNLNKSCYSNATAFPRLVGTLIDIFSFDEETMILHMNKWSISILDW